MARESARVLFGLHLATEHAGVRVPDLVENCDSCGEFALYAAAEGPDPASAHIGGCITYAELAEQHRLGHLLDLVPGTDAAETESAGGRGGLAAAGEHTVRPKD